MQPTIQQSFALNGFQLLSSPTIAYILNSRSEGSCLGTLAKLLPLNMGLCAVQAARMLIQLLGYDPQSITRPGQPGYGAGSGAPGVMLAYCKHLWATGQRNDALSRSDGQPVSCSTSVPQIRLKLHASDWCSLEHSISHCVQCIDDVQRAFLTHNWFWVVSTSSIMFATAAAVETLAFIALNCYGSLLCFQPTALSNRHTYALTCCLQEKLSKHSQFSAVGCVSWLMKSARYQQSPQHSL